MERGPSDDTQGETEEGDHRIKVDVNEMFKSEFRKHGFKLQIN